MADAPMLMGVTTWAARRHDWRRRRHSPSRRACFSSVRREAECDGQSQYGTSVTLQRVRPWRWIRKAEASWMLEERLEAGVVGGP